MESESGGHADADARHEDTAPSQLGFPGEGPEGQHEGRNADHFHQLMHRQNRPESHGGHPPSGGHGHALAFRSQLTGEGIGSPNEGQRVQSVEDAQDPHLILWRSDADGGESLEEQVLGARIGEVPGVRFRRAGLIPGQPIVVVFSRSPTGADFDHQEVVIVHQVARAECGGQHPQHEADQQRRKKGMCGEDPVHSPMPQSCPRLRSRRKRAI